MKNLNMIIAENLTNLRKQNKMTQSELASKFNYSDKAISKWERGEACPPIDVLCELANMYNVTLDYLTHEGTIKEKEKYVLKQGKANKVIIALLGVSLIWMLATIFFVYCKLIGNFIFWKVYLWAVPTSTVLLIIFNAIWGMKKFSLVLVSIFIWSLLACFYVQFLEYNLWAIFILGVPMQIATILWSNLRRR